MRSGKQALSKAIPVQEENSSKFTPKITSGCKFVMPIG